MPTLTDILLWFTTCKSSELIATEVGTTQLHVFVLNEKID